MRENKNAGQDRSEYENEEIDVEFTLCGPTDVRVATRTPEHQSSLGVITEGACREAVTRASAIFLAALGKVTLLADEDEPCLTLELRYWHVAGGERCPGMELKASATECLDGMAATATVCQALIDACLPQFLRALERQGIRLGL